MLLRVANARPGRQYGRRHHRSIPRCRTTVLALIAVRALQPRQCSGFRPVVRRGRAYHLVQLETNTKGQCHHEGLGRRCESSLLHHYILATRLAGACIILL